jgi:signal transduction histidine kinase
MLEQDQALEFDRLRTRLEQGATLIAQDLDRRLAEWETISGDRAAQVPQQSVLIRFDSSGVVGVWGTPIPYVPEVSTQDEPAAMFEAAEALEFRARDLPAACAAYRTNTGSREPMIRAGALMRWARCLRKQERPREALEAYATLATLGDVSAGGAPSELVARFERVRILTSLGETATAQAEQSRLRAALDSGRFRIDRATFQFFGGTDNFSELAAAVQALWTVTHGRPEGRSTWKSDSTVYAAVWRTDEASVTALLVGPLSSLIRNAQEIADGLGLQLSLDDLATQPPSAADGAPVLQRLIRDPALPWSLRVAVADPATAVAVTGARRRLFLAGFGLMTIVVLCASFVVVRAVQKQLAVARLKSEFVAAVSHEFRTPLTAMCHLTELLEDGHADSPRLPEYYRALGRESRRLRTLVERLLDFGRIESGRHTYVLTDVDAAHLTREVVEEIREQSTSAAQPVRWVAPSASSSVTHIHADRDAVCLALRNLIDNALKYSSDNDPVGVSVGMDGGFVRIAVEDAGPGISAHEQRDIFSRFVRGEAARAMNVKGTGIGLALASEIAKAHGGSVSVNSVVDQGSTFTLSIPVRAATPAQIPVSVVT